ncbi:hypothetical protein B0H21DRAFT_500036 [Amylocystis lapponica]|nr:hypothetical protein B0H21DRAFT_500036 [Amylocystis lapponica]
MLLVPFSLPPISHWRHHVRHAPALPPPLLHSAPSLTLPHNPQLPSQPKSVNLSANRLRSLPYRLTHPPSTPVRRLSWGFTSRFDISLDDILDRKHLPPLGLKDFEEWLLFVEEAPENLYFILWLREYSARYAAWTQHTKAAADARLRSLRAPSPRSQYRSPPPAPAPNPALALFYLRAKRTFLTPSAPYELDVPSDVLAPFHCPPLQPQVPVFDSESDCAHDSWSATTCAYRDSYGYAFDGKSSKLPPPPPDPAVFAELAERVQAELRMGLQRFVRATFRNVGSPRAICGCVGGACIGIGTSAPILVANFVTGGDRWWRVIALPGLWLGLTIFISAMYGVCMMIYVFGDLRQLRSFELSRPPISAPRPLSSPVLTPLVSPTTPVPFSPSSTVASQTPSSNGSWRRFARAKPAIPTISPPVRGSLITSAAVPGLTPLTRPPLAVRPPPTACTRDTPPRLRVITPVGVACENSPSIRWSRAAERASVSRRSAAGTIESHMPADDEDSDSDSDLDADSDIEPPTVGPRIQISDAFFDPHPAPEGPATAPCPPLWPDYVGTAEEESRATATFIHPFDDVGDSISISGGTLNGKTAEAQTAGARQRMDPFDFDALPPRRPRFAASPRRPPGSPPPSYTLTEKRSQNNTERDAVPEPRGGLRGLLGRAQTRCSPRNAAGMHVEQVNAELAKEKVRELGDADVDVDVEKGLALPALLVENAPEKEKESEARTWHARLRRASDVPAFAAPLTPVLSAVVARAQWEIVVHSGIMAALISCAVVGGLLGVPILR